MSDIIPIGENQSLAERFWSIARGMDTVAPNSDPVVAVRHVLAVLDALGRGETGDELSVNTLSFLKLLRDSEAQGDLCYASPEQIRGETLDERSLVFSVGVLLFERLTGRHPFGAEGNRRRRVARIRKGELGSGVNYFPTVPSSLRSVLMRAMGPFPEERFATLGELRARLEQFMSDQAPAPRLPGTLEKGREKSSEKNSGKNSEKSPEASSRVSPQKSAKSPQGGDSTRVVRRSTDFGRELMEVVDAHASTAREKPALPLRPPPEPEVEAGRRVSVEAADSASDRAPTTPHLLREVSDDDATTPFRTDAVASEDDAVPSLRSRPTGRTVLGRALWLGLGAAVAVAVMLVASSRDKGDSSAAGNAKAVPVAEAPVALAGKTPVEPRAAKRVAAAADDAAESPPGPAPASAGEFDPELAAGQMSTLLPGCFAAARTGTRFRIGVRYSGRTGTVSKVYFGSSDEISPAERICVRDRLLGLAAGSAPEKTVIVDYRIDVRARGLRVKTLVP